jgi:tetratricopeptide (TPR) repeat protein
MHATGSGAGVSTVSAASPRAGRVPSAAGREPGSDRPGSRNGGREPGGLIAAALIVRDEAAYLGACLESIRPVVDDIVVVDTGSVDGTPALAAAHGARVFHRAWNNDFAAARNAALDHCGTDWILYIDADERLDPVERSALAAQLAAAPEVAFRLLLRPCLGTTAYREYRLWRNDPRIRFSGAIHEKVVPAIHAVAASDQRPIGRCDLQLTHVGYEGDQTRKHHRNLPLLRRQVRAEPENLFNWHHLARVLDGLGQPQASERVLRHAVQIAAAKPFIDPCGVLAYSDLIAIRHARGEDVAGLLAEARGRYPRNCLLVWQEARVLTAGGRDTEAIAALDWLLGVDLRRLPDEGPAYDARLFGELAHEGRGLCLFRLGRYEEAAEAYAAAARCAPARPEYLVKRNLALARARRANEDPAAGRSIRKEDPGAVTLTRAACPAGP